MQISRRDALMGASAAVAVAAVPTAVGAQADDAELTALGRQWIVAYGEWIGTEDADSTLSDRRRTIETKIEDMPARSHHGALVKLRIAAESLRLMGDIENDLDTRLTYQAWQALETEPFDFERLIRGVTI